MLKSSHFNCIVHWKTGMVRGLLCFRCTVGTEGILKDLQEMNLVDDFLVNSLTSHKIYGERASRYILECIFRRKIGKLTVVPQRFLCGENTGDHGIRLDVYLDEEAGELFDMEPDQNDSRAEKESLPRRVRFYHAKIDAGNLAAGEDYGKLRNVVVIFITTYDPFDRDRMVYTIRNCCVEEPDLPYEDGAETLFLYTKGTKGDPPRELRELLRYMEDSTEENAGSEGLKTLHRMVTEVKRDGEVGFAYMKSFEREQRVREEARREGLSEGLDKGRREGLSEGLSEGKTEDLLAVLRCKGEVPEALQSKILSEKDLNLLNDWFLRALSCECYETFYLMP